VRILSNTSAPVILPRSHPDNSRRLQTPDQKNRMQRGSILWTVFVVLGALLWLASTGVWRHPVYRLGLTLTVLSWFAYVVSFQPSNRRRG